MASDWFAVYESATGRLVSTGTVVARDAELTKRGLVKKALAFDPQVPTRQWNESTQDFDVVVPPKPRVQVQDFVDRFTPAEREALSDAARSHPTPAVRTKIAAFNEYLRTASVISLDDSYITASVGQMETVGLIGAGRAAEVLA